MLSMDAQDVLGTHIVDMKGTLQKIRHTKEGNYINAEKYVKKLLL
jgi:hypothetical protein